MSFSNKLTLRNEYPGLKTYGVPFIIPLVAAGSLAASDTVVVDAFTVGATTMLDNVFLPSNRSDYIRAVAAIASVQTIGTSNSAGGLTWRVYSNNTAAILQGTGGNQATGTIAYNATGAALQTITDLRDPQGNGVSIGLNDIIKLYVHAVPTTTGAAPTNLTVKLICVCFGVLG